MPVNGAMVLYRKFPRQLLQRNIVRVPDLFGPGGGRGREGGGRTPSTKASETVGSTQSSTRLTSRRAVVGMG